MPAGASRPAWVLYTPDPHSPPPQVASQRQAGLLLEEQNPPQETRAGGLEWVSQVVGESIWHLFSPLIISITLWSIAVPKLVIHWLSSSRFDGWGLWSAEKLRHVPGHAALEKRKKGQNPLNSMQIISVPETVLFPTLLYTLGKWGTFYLQIKKKNGCNSVFEVNVLTILHWLCVCVCRQRNRESYVSKSACLREFCGTEEKQLRPPC